MTVAELMEKLKDLPPDVRVAVLDKRRDNLYAWQHYEVVRVDHLFSERGEYEPLVELTSSEFPVDYKFERKPI